MSKKFKVNASHVVKIYIFLFNILDAHIMNYQHVNSYMSCINDIDILLSLAVDYDL